MGIVEVEKKWELKKWVEVEKKWELKKWVEVGIEEVGRSG